MNIALELKAMAESYGLKTFYYSSGEDKWEFGRFEDQLTEAVAHYEPWPERGGLFLKAQQLLVEGAVDNNLELRTILRVVPGTKTAILLAHLSHRTDATLRSVHLKLTIDRDRPNRAYTGVYSKPPRYSGDPDGPIEKRFRYASMEVLNAKLAEEFEPTPPFDFCTDFGPGD